MELQVSSGLLQSQGLWVQQTQKFVHTRTQEKGEVTPQVTDPDLPLSVQESLAEAWVDSGLLWDQGH